MKATVENWHILKHGCFGNLSSILYGLGFIREKIQVQLIITGCDEPTEDTVFLSLGNKELFGSFSPGLHELYPSPVAKSLMARWCFHTWRALAGTQHEVGDAVKYLSV